MKSLQYCASSAREALENDKYRDDIYDRINEAHKGIFENPPELKALPWIQERKFVTTAPADALNAAIRTFASRMPQLEIQPLSDAPEEYDRVEQHESLMKWEFERMNRVGKKSPHWKIVEYAMKYCAVAIETTYLPFEYQKYDKTPRIKEILRSKHFRWNVHSPRNIHVRESDDIIESVVNCDVLTAQQVVDRFGEENQGVREMLQKIDLKDPRALNQTKFSFFDYTDWDTRCMWIAENSGSAQLNRTAPSGIEIMRKERKISFLPWVFVDNEEPLLKGMIEAGLWDNVNILRAMQFSKAVDMAAHPEYWIRTPDGTLRNVNIDATNPNQPLVTGPGVDVTKLPPPGLDPQLSTLTTTAEQEVFRTTVAQILASVEKYAGTQNFSVVNAMLNAAVAQLALAQMVAERAETLAMVQNFKWIDETEIPMVGFRPFTKSEGKQRGQEIAIQKGEFDVDYLYLTMKLNPSSVMDKQTEINNAVNKVERLGMSLKQAWNELGLENYDLSQSQKTEELLYQAMTQAKAREIMAESELKVQEKAQQTQFAAQQGMDNRAGGMTATSPGQGREQLNGQAASGQELA